ncbi:MULTISPECIES: hypothetical protein [Acidobacterium]|uniref:Uncharacterized protein n=1 Tax=Acidobacterium capsulatum (strain ATCC 51196 / DSM 11244 / BCRC 80197 / JCM 7670 / NBRC 15755 / NCIMB 13165 / 161) TaxID=240015 RepID=C1F4V6_ACIC5|nr:MULTISPECIES: hypothetical protein [Acidobacterium]ACO31620.1 hypothetical protein ACP_1228 [Acidobacterium capsulatum ATCC 51196]
MHQTLANGLGLIPTGTPLVFAEWDFREAGKKKDRDNGPHEEIGLHWYEIKAVQGNVRRCDQKERACDVAVYSPTSCGVRKARSTHNQKSRKPEQQFELWPIGSDDKSGDWEPPEKNGVAAACQVGCCLIVVRHRQNSLP